MIRLSGIFFVFIAVLCAVLLFQTSQSVQSLEDELQDIEAVNKREKEEIRVLSAEWDYLNNPARLEKIIQEKTGLQNEIHPLIKVKPTQKPKYIEAGGWREY